MQEQYKSKKNNKYKMKCYSADHTGPDIEAIQTLKKEFNEQIKERLIPSVTTYHWMATILNPASRDNHFWSKGERDNALKAIKVLIDQQKKDGSNFINSQIIRDNEKNDDLNIDSADIGESMDDIMDFSDDAPPLQCDELDDYLSIRFLSDEKRSYTNNPMIYWNKNKTKFPCLYEISRMVLIKPTSNAGSESIFSAAQWIVNARRNKTNADTLDDLIFLSSFYEIPEDERKWNDDDQKNQNKQKHKKTINLNINQMTK